MPDAGVPGDVFRAELEQVVDERARLEVFAVEPLVEDVEDADFRRPAGRAQPGSNFVLHDFGL